MLERAQVEKAELRLVVRLDDSIERGCHSGQHQNEHDAHATKLQILQFPRPWSLLPSHRWL